MVFQFVPFKYRCRTSARTLIGTKLALVLFKSGNGSETTSVSLPVCTPAPLFWRRVSAMVGGLCRLAFAQGRVHANIVPLSPHANRARVRPVYGVLICSRA